MDRRTFLKTLASLGVSISLPLDLVNASQEDVQAAWTVAVGDWDLFEVNAFGTLSCADYQEGTTRRELYWYSTAEDFGVNDVDDRYLLAEKIKALYREELLLEARRDLSTNGIEDEALEDQVEEGWFDWFEEADGITREAINAEIEAWLDEEPDWENEWEYFYRGGTAQGAAYIHFTSEDRDLMEALGIVVIEGDCPGSSYFAAELRKPIDEANRIAEQNGWAIRFVAEGAA